MIQELLQKWAELEPGRCDRQSVSYWVKVEPSGYSIPFEHMTSIDWAMLQSAVFEAIESHTRYKLENSRDLIYAEILNRYDSVPSRGAHQNRTIALLSAYISWLQRLQAVAQRQSEGWEIKLGDTSVGNLAIALILPIAHWNQIRDALPDGRERGILIYETGTEEWDIRSSSRPLEPALLTRSISDWRSILDALPTAEAKLLSEAIAAQALSEAKS